MHFHYAFPMEQIRHITLPGQAHTALHVLERAGYSAWLVGGFVRDALRGVEAHDLDIATNARWESVKQSFLQAGYAVHETGTKHGTVTVVVDGCPIEITTFRTENTYSDSRHPDSVVFVDSIEADLARRDFTMNAIAYHPKKGFFDPYDGRKAIKECRIECVGNPSARFAEDALRIMRGIRFAAQLGFAIQPDTADAMLDKRRGLENVARERIQDELSRFLMGAHAGNVLPFASPIIETVVPELEGALEASATQTSALLAQSPHDLSARYASLFLGPSRFSRGLPQHWHTQPIGETTKKALTGLRVKKDVAVRASMLAESLDSAVLPSTRNVHRFIVDLGGDVELARISLKLQSALTRTACPQSPETKTMADACLTVLEDLARRKRPFSVHDLALSGKDLLALGVEPGPEIRRLLQAALNQCIEFETENTRKALLALISDLKITR